VVHNREGRELLISDRGRGTTMALRVVNINLNAFHTLIDTSSIQWTRYDLMTDNNDTECKTKFEMWT